MIEKKYYAGLKTIIIMMMSLLSVYDYGQEV